MTVRVFFKMRILGLFMVALSLFLFKPLVCNGETMDNQKEISSITQGQWESLSYKFIYFGHQSVGSNIMEGVHSVIENNPSIKINIVKYNKDLVIENPSFVDNKNLGKNNDPESKINQFVSDVSKNKYDIAFMKFCFDDIFSTTDIYDLFEKYKTKMEFVRSKSEDLVVVHFTVPLLVKTEPTLKSKIKGLLGMGGGYFDNSHNVARNKFNQLLIEEYGGREPIFDLAKHESTYLDGEREAFEADGKTYYSLVPEYTNDRAHLNEKGREYVAKKLLSFLAKLI